MGSYASGWFPYGMGNEVSTPSVDARLAVLAHPERRRLVAELLAAEADTEVSVVAGSDADVERLRLAMHHVHVPKLAEQGIVERGETPLHVRRGPAFDAVVPLLRTVSEHAATTVRRRV